MYLHPVTVLLQVSEWKLPPNYAHDYYVLTQYNVLVERILVIKLKGVNSNETNTDRHTSSRLKSGFYSTPAVADSEQTS